MPHPSTLLLALCLALPGLVTADAPWSRFRGLNGDGISDADTVPVSWKQSDFKWKTKLPGSGHSSCWTSPRNLPARASRRGWCTV